MKRSIVFSFIFFSLFSASVMGAGAGKLFDLLVNESGLMDVLARRGIEGVPADKVGVFVKNSLKSFTPDGSMPTGSQLKKIVSDIKSLKTDSKHKKRLLELLEKDSDKLSKDELVDAVNSLIFLSSRYGRRGSTILACAECVSDSLGRHGFKYTLEEVRKANIKEILENNVVPRHPTDLSKYISGKMRRLKMGSYSKSSRGVVSPEEKRTFGVFLALADPNGPATKNQRELIDAILSVSTQPDGTVKLLSKDNSHKLWKILIEQDMDDNLSKQWADLLREVAEEGKDSVSKKDAFYKVLRRRAGDDQVLNEQVDALRMKGCYFK